MGEAVLLDRSWQLNGLCRGNHSHLFFPPERGRAQRGARAAGSQGQGHLRRLRSARRLPRVRPRDPRALRDLGRHDRDRAAPGPGPPGARLRPHAPSPRAGAPGAIWGPLSREPGHNSPALVCSPCGRACGGPAGPPRFHRSRPSPRPRGFRGADGSPGALGGLHGRRPRLPRRRARRVRPRRSGRPGGALGGRPRGASLAGGRPARARRGGRSLPHRSSRRRGPAGDGADLYRRAGGGRGGARRRSPGLLLQLGDPARRPAPLRCPLLRGGGAAGDDRGSRPHRGHRSVLGGARRGAAPGRRRGVAGRVPHSQAPRSPGRPHRRRCGGGVGAGGRPGWCGSSRGSSFEDDGTWRVLLPGEAGYEEAPA